MRTRFRILKVTTANGNERFVVKDTANGSTVVRDSGGKIYRYKSHAKKDAFRYNRFYAPLGTVPSGIDIKPTKDRPKGEWMDYVKRRALETAK